MLEKPAKPERSIPAHQSVYEVLRRSILFGDFAPGQPLTIQGLVEHTKGGMTPVREALRRLTSEGAVTMLSNRRLCVPVLSASDVEELVFMRKTLEPELARRAAALIPADEILALRKIDEALNQTISLGDVQGYLQRNFEFHSRLYAWAAAPILADTVDQLWLRFGPSLRVLCGRFGTTNLPDRHIEMIEALERRDPDAAAAATFEDVSDVIRIQAGLYDSIDAR